MMITRENRRWGKIEEEKWGIDIIGDLTLGGEHTMQYTDDVFVNCTPETYIILLPNVAPINSTKHIHTHNKCQTCLGLNADSVMSV